MSFPYLNKHGSIYYFRIRIPHDLQQWFSGKEIKRSLKTRNLTQAKKLVKVWSSRVDKLFVSIRSGIFSEAQVSELIQKHLPSPNTSSHKPQGRNLSDVAQSFILEQSLSSKWTEKTKGDYQKVISLFIEYVGNRPIDKINRKIMVNFLEGLSRLPANINKSPKYRNLSLDEILSLSEVKPMSIYTANKYMSRVNAMMIRSVGQGFIDRNPSEGLTIAVQLKQDEERKA